MATAATEYEKLVEKLAEGDAVTAAQMFGKPCLKVSGKAFVAQHKETVVFKLTGPEHQKEGHGRGGCGAVGSIGQGAAHERVGGAACWCFQDVWVVGDGGHGLCGECGVAGCDAPHDTSCCTHRQRAHGPRLLRDACRSIFHPTSTKSVKTALR